MRPFKFRSVEEVRWFKEWVSTRFRFLAYPELATYHELFELAVRGVDIYMLENKIDKELIKDERTRLQKALSARRSRAIKDSREASRLARVSSCSSSPISKEDIQTAFLT